MWGLARLGPFDEVIDVGGNLGDFAEECWDLWQPRTVSFEPIPPVAERNRERAQGRWTVMEVAVSDRVGVASLRVCMNQHTASTMQEPGSVRRDRFGISDTFREIEVETAQLDTYYGDRDFGSLLVKVDVEGHEGAVIRGATRTLSRARAAIVEVQQDSDIFLGSPGPGQVDEMLRDCGLKFAGVLDALAAPDGGIVQFDGLWLRVP